VLAVTRLDRPSARDLSNTLVTITDRNAGFRSLGDTWADATTAHGRVMLTALGGFADFERELIRARTGRKRRYAAGEAVRETGKESLANSGRSYNVSAATISRLSV
jgi:DNA invertase Pin-like site-specific DNA recombinase